MNLQDYDECFESQQLALEAYHINELEIQVKQTNTRIATNSTGLDITSPRNDEPPDHDSMPCQDPSLVTPYCPRLCVTHLTLSEHPSLQPLAKPHLEQSLSLSGENYVSCLLGISVHDPRRDTQRSAARRDTQRSAAMMETQGTQRSAAGMDTQGTQGSAPAARMDTQGTQRSAARIDDRDTANIPHSCNTQPSMHVQAAQLALEHRMAVITNYEHCILQYADLHAEIIEVPDYQHTDDHIISRDMRRKVDWTTRM